MNRRSFLGILGIAPLVLAVGHILPKQAEFIHVNDTGRGLRRWQPRSPLDAYIKDWQPCTAYNVGDLVRFSNGQVITVAMAGTSASVETINGTIVPLRGNF